MKDSTKMSRNVLPDISLELPDAKRLQIRFTKAEFTNLKEVKRPVWQTGRIRKLSRSFAACVITRFYSKEAPVC